MGYYPQFARLLSQMLAYHDRTAAWLAKSVGVSGATVSRWLSGEIRPKGPETVIKIADSLGVYDSAERQNLLASVGYGYQATGDRVAGVGQNDGQRAAEGKTGGAIDIEHKSTGAILSGAPPLPSLLVGREKDINALHKQLMGETDVTLLTAIRGWPGVGKTTLAATLAHDALLQQAFSDGVLWTALGEEPSLLLALGEWMMALGDDPQRYPTVEGRSSRLRTMLQQRKMLLFIDDVWRAEQAAPFLVGGRDCRTLITTRQPEVARNLGLPPQAVYLLGILSDAESLELLRTLAPDATNMMPSETSKLVQMLEGLPLALQVAGRLLAEEAALGWGVGDLLSELLEGTTLMNAKAPADRTDLETQTTPTIAVLFRKSTDRLDPETRDRFALLGVFVPKPATFDAAAAGAAWDVVDPKPVLRALVNRGLLEPAMDGRFQMHSLLTVHARMLCEEEDKS